MSISFIQNYSNSLNEFQYTSFIDTLVLSLGLHRLRFRVRERWLVGTPLIKISSVRSIHKFGSSLNRSVWCPLILNLSFLLHFVVSFFLLFFPFHVFSVLSKVEILVTLPFISIVDKSLSPSFFNNILSFHGLSIGSLFPFRRLFPLKQMSSLTIILLLHIPYLFLYFFSLFWYGSILSLCFPRQNETT